MARDARKGVGMSRISNVVGIVVVAVAAMMTPASAETYVTQGPECNWGDASSALFKENAENAAWEISAIYRNKGGSNKTSPGKLYAAARGTYRVTATPSGPKQKIVAITVRSSGSVEAAGGGQCTVVSGACKASCMDAIPATPADDLMIPAPEIPLPSQVLIFELP